MVRICPVCQSICFLCRHLCFVKPNCSILVQFSFRCPKKEVNRNVPFVDYSRTLVARTHTNNENKLEAREFEIMSVNHSARSGGITNILKRKSLISFQFSLTLKYNVCSHWNRLIEAILMSSHNSHFQYKNHPKLSQTCSYWIFSKGLKNKFKTAVVNEPLLFEPLKIYCIWLI